VDPRAGAVRRHPGLLHAGWHRDLETAVYAPASFIPHGALTNARPRRARRTACLDPRITAGSESFSMSCRRRSKRAACAATSTSSAAHRLRPRLPRRRRRPEHRLRRRPHEKGRRRAHRRDQGRGPRPRRKPPPSATDWTTTGSTSMRRSSCRAATMCGRRSSTTALESSSPAPWPSTCWR